MSFIQTLKTSDGLRFSILTLGSYMLAALLAAVTIIVISRFLGPVDFALFSTAMALSMIINQFNSFGLSVVIQKYVGGSHQSERISRFLSVCLRYRLFLSLLITSLGLIFAKQIAAYLQLDHQWLMVVTILCSLAPTYFDSSQVTLQSLGKLKLAAINYLLPALLKFALAILIFVFKWQSVELILALYLLSTIPSIILAEWKLLPLVKYQLLGSFPKEEKLVLQMLKHSAFAVLALGLIDNVDLLIAKHYLSNYETGLLAGASRIAMLLAVVSGALASVLFPRVAKYRDRSNLRNFLNKAWLVALLLLASMVAIPFLSPWLIKLSIGAAYLPANAALNLLLIAGVLNIISVVFTAPFYAFTSNRYFSLAAFLQLVLILLGNLLFVPTFGLMASALTRLVVKIVLLLFTLLMLWMTWKKEFRR